MYCIVPILPTPDTDFHRKQENEENDESQDSKAEDVPEFKVEGESDGLLMVSPDSHIDKEVGEDISNARYDLDNVPD